MVALKKPSSLVQFWSYIFVILGLIFIVSGYLKGDPSIIFTITGNIFLALGLIILFITINMENKRRRLRTVGLRVDGVVTKIKKLTYIKWGRVSPYLVYFYYERYGFKYEGKSFLIWDKANVAEGEKIDVYINDDKRHHCFLKL